MIAAELGLGPHTLASRRVGIAARLSYGFMETWRIWELVVPALERRRDVLAVTLPGHASGPPLESGASTRAVVDAVERQMDDAGFEVANLVVNSLGGYIALHLAGRERATMVVAFARAGGWAPDDKSYRELLQFQRSLYEQMKARAPHADSLVRTPEGRRRASALITSNFEHIPAELLAHLNSRDCSRPGSQLADRQCAPRGVESGCGEDYMSGSRRMGNR